MGGGEDDDDDKGVDPGPTYETDEEEFLDNMDRSPVVATFGPDTRLSREPLKAKNIAKRQISARGWTSLGMTWHTLTFGGQEWL